MFEGEKKDEHYKVEHIMENMRKNEEAWEKLKANRGSLPARRDALLDWIPNAPATRSMLTVQHKEVQGR